MVFFYRKEIKTQKILIKNSIFFDAHHYAAAAKCSMDDDIYEFYLRNWRKYDINPSRFFDSSFYLNIYEDVRASGINPLVHYILHGWREGRAPSPHFDRSGFLAAHNNIDPLKLDPALSCITLYGDYRWNIVATTSPQSANGVAHYNPTEEISEFASAKCGQYFDSEYYTSTYPDVAAAGANPFLHYMTFGHKENRNPSAGFDTFFYRNNYLSQNLARNPLLHFIEGGMELKTLPDTSIVLRTESETDQSQSSLKICVHVHCFYPEQLGEICKGLKNFPQDIYTIFTVCSSADRQFVQNYVQRYMPYLSFDAIVVENRGRDIAPFLVSTAAKWMASDLVLHIHTKGSKHISWGSVWRSYLFDQLIGSASVVQAVIRSFSEDEKLGALYPENFFEIKKYTQLNPNLENIASVISFLGIDSSQWVARDFAAGSMSWYRTAALKPLIDKVNSIDLFEFESGQVDNTLAHALERIIPAAIERAGFEAKSYATARRISLGKPLDAPSRDAPSTVVTSAWPRDTPRAALAALLPLSPRSSGFNSASLDIHWVIPSFGKGAGGHTTIFRIVSYLEQFGHKQTIWLQGASNMPDEGSARQRICDWYFPIGNGVDVMFLPDDLRQLSGDVIIATDCWTAFPVSRAVLFKERFYFVQDYEPDFHAAGANQLVAAETYNFGFAALSAGAWLDEIMRAKNLWSHRWDLSVDHDVYFPRDIHSVALNTKEEISIAFYARPYTPRRAVELGFAALEQLHLSGRRFKAHLFGEIDLKVDYNFPYQQHGILSHDQLAELYRQSDVGLVFSSTNYSLIPLEMMACGLPVVELDVPSTRTVFQNNEVKFARPTPHDIVDAINCVVNNIAETQAQINRGYEFVTAHNWELSARSVEAGLKTRLKEIGFRDIANFGMKSFSISRQPQVSVFIPTYNAGPALKDVLSRLTKQKAEFKYDVLLIDSGSTDDTLDIAKSFHSDNVRVSEIPNSEFQHGRTRNLGISMTEGEYVAVLTQDALPADENWLSSLISGFGAGKRIAGVTGRHVAYPEHGPFIAQDIKQHFDNLSLLPRVVDKFSGLPSFIYPGSITWRMLAYFYSDNNSAMSREFWREIPYPEIDWGEDYVWASLVLKAGFQKGYVNDAVVYHSHDLSDRLLYKTAVTEGRFWGREFGIRLNHDLDAAISQANARDKSFARALGIDAGCLNRRMRANELLIRGRAQGWAESQRL